MTDEQKVKAKCPDARLTAIVDSDDRVYGYHIRDLGDLIGSSATVKGAWASAAARIEASHE